MKEEYTAMNTRIPRTTLLARLLLTLGCTTTGLVSTAQADVQGLNLPVPVAQEPIGRSTGLPPNVLFIMDDSSSMTKSYMPDNLQVDIEPLKLPEKVSLTEADVCVLIEKPSNKCLKRERQKLYYPGGHAYSGRLYFDTHGKSLPKNAMRFEPERVYSRWATGEPRPSPNADLPRVKDTNKQAVLNRDAKLWLSCPYYDQGCRQGFVGGQERLWTLDQWIKHYKTYGAVQGVTIGTLPPLYVLRHNEKNLKAKYGNTQGNKDDATDIGNYVIINFVLDTNYNYHHTEVRRMKSDDAPDNQHAISQAYSFSGKKRWPDNQPFIFTDKDGKEIYKGTPRELFDNYFNYLVYHNSRMHVAKAALMEAMADSNGELRAGFTNINHGLAYAAKPTISPSSTAQSLTHPIPVGKNNGLFKGNNRTEFANEFFKSKADGNTPLFTAMHAAGEYYSDTSKDGPYADEKGEKGSKIFSCRQNLSILVTDGYYNDKASKFGDVDSTFRNDIHKTMRSPSGVTYRYEPSAPYRDGVSVTYSDTLADVAMYYWVKDLVPGNSAAGKNNVPVTGRDPAFWQHMRTYAIGFGVAGSLDITKPAPGSPGSQTNTWPNPKKSLDPNDPWAEFYELEKADDLWHATVNGRGAFFTTNDGFGLTAVLKSILDEANPGTAPGSTSAASSYLFRDTESGNVLQFRATYNSSNLSSDLMACKLGTNCEGGVTWSVSERLGELLAGNLGRERNIFANVSTSGGVDLQPFQWSNLNTTQKQTLAGSDDNLGQDTVRYLRGDTTLDGQLIAHPDSSDPQNAKWRTRADLGGAGRNVLGMVVHGTPTFIGAPEDIRTELSSTLRGYKDFQRANKDRPNVLYAAANDGMVHAFITERKTVPVTAGGITTTATYEPGDELFAFIPAAAINKNMRDFTRATFEFSQHYLLDGELNYSEVKLGDEWKTVLVGSMGAAGAPPNATPTVFALDVTNPGNPKLLWEVTAEAMGQTMGRPVIAPVADGKWSVFIGSGPNQSETRSHSAILQIDLETGTVTTLQSGEMASVGDGGILGLHVVDADHDNYADTIYAGDLSGNVWKVSGIGGSSVEYKRLFTAPQPITAPLTSTLDKQGVRWLFFGTGKALVDADLTDKSQIRTWYGIQDLGEEVKENELIEREYNVVKIQRTPGAEEEDAVVMNYAIAGDMDGKKGWMIPLNQSGDRDAPGYFLLQNRIRDGYLVGQMNFTVSAEPSCDGLTTPSRLMVLDPFTGAVSPENPNKGNIDVNNDGEVDEKDLYGGSGGIGGNGGGGNGGTGGLPIVGLGFGSGETSGSILIVQEQRTKPGTGTPSPSGDVKDDIESTRTCALDANGVRVCLPPNPTGKPPSTHTWSELRYDDAP